MCCAWNSFGRTWLPALAAASPSPLVVDDVMYVVGKEGAIVAFDAVSGKQIWTHPVEGQPTNRGFNFWQNKDHSDRRLIFGANSYLQEINLKTGVTINTFGKDVRVDLREGLGRDPKPSGTSRAALPDVSSKT